MKKNKYFYNTHTLRFEKLEISILQKLFRVFGFLSATAVFAFIIVVLAYTYLDSPKEKKLKRDLSQMELQYDVINDKVEQVNQVLANLQERDDNLYRVIFEADPIPGTIREAGYGGGNRYKNLENYSNAKLIVNTHKKLDKIKKQMYIQSKSYDEVYSMVKDKANMLASIPAVQPISNKDLKRMASGFGVRIDPIYKTPKMHTGIDFTAPTATDVYATGNGTVVSIDFSDRGYGNNVVIDHGYGYQSLYAHLNKVKVRPGQKVKRGDVIGLVGSTGKSTAPHLHYEVIKDNRKINPINYFYNDLSPEQYDEMLEIASRHSQAFD